VTESAAAEAASEVVSVQGLVKHFREVAAVDGIAFTVKRGETVALLGGNGAGKTTTISMLLGLLEPTEGAIRLFGLDIAKQRHRVLGRMNFSSPYVDLPHRLTLRQNLMVFAKLYGLNDAKARIAELSKALELEALLDRRVGSLSAGRRPAARSPRR
jgi:ABC-2 type transport system ATP-binding protein